MIWQPSHWPGGWIDKGFNCVNGWNAQSGGVPHRNHRVKPMNKLLPMHLSKRCGAHSRRTGKPCMNGAMKNGRCRMHGGKATGAPKGNRNAWKHGNYSAGEKSEASVDAIAVGQIVRGCSDNKASTPAHKRELVNRVCCEARRSATSVSLAERPLTMITRNSRLYQSTS